MQPFHLVGFGTPELLTVLYVTGIIAESMTAAVTACRMRMDLFGVITLGVLTALGGGTVRDIMLGSYPLTWVEEPKFLVICVLASVITMWLKWLMYQLRKFFLVADAIGLAAFVVLGIQTALANGHGFVIAAVAAVVTGVFGGVIRDILSDRVPLVLREELYASIAIMGTVVYVVLLRLGVPEWAVVIATVVFVFGMRLLSLKFRWSLPTYEYDEEKFAEFDPRYQLTSFLRSRARSVPGARQVYRQVKYVQQSAPRRHRRRGHQGDRRHGGQQR